MNRFEVWLVNLDPTFGSEIQKTRPAVIVSLNELNSCLSTIIVVPLTTGRTYPFRIKTQAGGKEGAAVIDDQIRAVDRQRLIKKIDIPPPRTGLELLNSLCELFAP